MYTRYLEAQEKVTIILNPLPGDRKIFISFIIIHDNLVTSGLRARLDLRDVSADKGLIVN